MPYDIHLYRQNQSGSPLVTLADRAIDDTTTPLQLVGRFTPGYGEAWNESLVWLLENFAGPSEPSGALIGMHWFDTDSDVMKYRNNAEEWQTVVYQGGSFEAVYADVAERYAASEPLFPGDVVEIGGPKEIQRTRHDTALDVFGVISTTPAIHLNRDAGNDETHPYVALVGRVPCKVLGPIRKGQRLVASEVPGVARGAKVGDPLMSMFGRSLRDDDATGVRLVEIALGGR